MKYTEEIFNILSRGGFISANSVSSTVKRYYDALEEDFTEYYDYYKGIGFYLEAGNGYYLFTRQETRVDLERKLEAVGKWIDYLSFLKTYHSAFGPGFLFRRADIEVQIGCNMELKEKASRLFSDKKKFGEVVEKLVAELEKAGMIELENEHDETYKVLTAFHYMEEMVDCITILEDTSNVCLSISSFCWLFIRLPVQPLLCSLNRSAFQLLCRSFVQTSGHTFSPASGCPLVRLFSRLTV